MKIRNDGVGFYYSVSGVDGYIGGGKEVEIVDSVAVVLLRRIDVSEVSVGAVVDSGDLVDSGDAVVEVPGVAWVKRDIIEWLEGEDLELSGRETKDELLGMVDVIVGLGK